MAIRTLRRAGVRVIAKNVRTPTGEIDVIGLTDRGETVVVVEVRTVASPLGPERAVDAVTMSKARQVVRTVEGLLTTRRGRRLMQDRRIRFDVVGVDMRTGAAEHVVDAWPADV